MGSQNERAIPQRHTPEDLEPVVLEVWREVLEDPGLAAGDDFFAAGGDSLLAVQAMSKVTEVTGIEVPATTVFTSPTATEFAEALVEVAGAGGR